MVQGLRGPYYGVTRLVKLDWDRTAVHNAHYQRQSSKFLGKLCKPREKKLEILIQVTVKIQFSWNMMACKLIEFFFFHNTNKGISIKTYTFTYAPLIL